ncbi:MAG: hypothetical protein P1U69_03150 [Parvibaculaceae bacterium]|nr:hypothetical protein [Parvibaculaceae bacterium]HBM88792.1 hypothetical protein [Rhodobiaceae bacterium]
MRSYDDKFQRLSDLGAGDFAHLNGSLEEHFVGVYDLLVEWNAARPLQDAGLFHAAYGTSGFTDQMVSLDQRHLIAEIIGEEAEAIVYLYCSCDRDVFWPRIGVAEPLLFKDRFSDTELEPSQQQLREFCELTAANELQLAAADPSFADQYRAEFIDVFARMAPWLTLQATAYSRSVLRSTG